MLRVLQAVTCMDRDGLETMLMNPAHRPHTRYGSIS